jgi:hypothetical protein
VHGVISHRTDLTCRAMNNVAKPKKGAVSYEERYLKFHVCSCLRELLNCGCSPDRKAGGKRQAGVGTSATGVPRQVFPEIGS